MQDASSKIYANNATLESKISTLSTNVSKQNEALQQEFKDQLTQSINSLSTNVTAMVIPDYSKGEGGSLPFVAPKDGVVYFNILINNSGANIYINEVFVAYYSDQSDGSARDNFTFVLGKGDKLTCSSGVNNFVFFPMKGAV